MSMNRKTAPPGQTFDTKHFLMRDLSAAEINKALDQTVNKEDLNKKGEGQRRGQVIQYNFRKLWTPGKGCGTPTPYPGTSGKAPCGVTVNGEPHYCHYCQANAVAEALMESDAKAWMLDQPLQPIKGMTNPMDMVVYSIGVGTDFVAFDFIVYDDGSIQMDAEIDSDRRRTTRKLKVVRVPADKAVEAAKNMIGAARRYLEHIGITAELSARRAARAERGERSTNTLTKFVDEGDAFIQDITRNVDKILKSRLGESIAKDWLMQQEWHVPSVAATTFYLSVDEEDHEPDWDEPDDPDDLRRHRRMMSRTQTRLAQGDNWAYGAVAVSAVWVDPETERTYSGDDYLGGCSYRNALDFMRSSGYFEDMMQRAYDELVKNFRREHESVSPASELSNNVIEVPEKFKQSVVEPEHTK